METAKTIGQYATNAGMSVLIDFHYSDFWADPSKQFTPKAWADMDIDEKEEALYEYTKESVQYLLDNGVNVEMVQVGNETTTSGMCGETNWKNVCRLFNAGSKAIREVSSDIKVVLHFANPEKKGKYAEIAKTLADNEVDYDVFASSYYPYWHGSLENLTNVLADVANTYGKEVMVAETSWAYTLEDGDGSGNTVSETANSTNQPYTFDVVGQQAEIWSVTNAVKEVGDAAIGIYYWENAWTPVDSSYWEKGAGWATSYAGSYDPKDAGKYYGGCAVDNQAWFDFDGHALETCSIYKDIEEGKTFEEGLIEIETAETKADSADNILDNYGFELGDLGNWEKLDGTTGSITGDDPFTGDLSYHYWASSKFSIGVTQTINVEPGLYTFGGYLQGSQFASGESYKIYVIVNEKKYYAEVTPAGWVVWQNPEIINIPVSEKMDITVGFEADCVAGAWGTWDDFYLFRTGDYDESYEGQIAFEDLNGEDVSVEAETTDETVAETQTEETSTEDAELEASQQGFISGQIGSLVVVIIMAILLTLATWQMKKNKDK